MKTLNELQTDFNTDKIGFYNDIVKNSVDLTNSIIDKTKDKDAHVKMKKANGELVSGYEKMAKGLTPKDAIPDLQIVSGVSSKDLNIEILNKSDFSKKYKITDKIPFVFKVTGINNYIYIISLTNKSGHGLQLLGARHTKPEVSIDIHLDLIFRKHSPPIVLPDDDYFLSVILFDVNQQPLKRSSDGKDVLDRVALKLDLSGSTATDTTKPFVRIIKPKNGDTIKKNGPIDIEFETNVSPPYRYNVTMPNNGGIIYIGDNKKTNNTIHPGNYYVSDIKIEEFEAKPIKLRPKKADTLTLNIIEYGPLNKSLKMIVSDSIQINVE